MSTDTPPTAPPNDPLAKKKGEAKTAPVARKFPLRFVADPAPARKPEWIRVRAGSPTTRFYEIKDILRRHRLHTVCEEASCPNIGECFGKGTATFMIMGDKCTRRCPFCDVGHGRPDPLDADEPANLARTIAELKLRYVVITSVDRDDLKDGGAQHFVDCIRAVRALAPSTRIEILVPDFRGRLDRALAVLETAPPDVMNHNLETVPRLYRESRPGAARGRHADPRPVPGPERPPPARAPLRDAGDVRTVRTRGAGAGLLACGGGTDGAQFLSCRPAGACRRRGLTIPMPAAPNWLAGSFTAAALVAFGIFVYPWLLGRRRGSTAVALITAALAVLYFYFDQGRGDALGSAVFALLWAAAPLLVGVIVHRLQRR